jgi:hypothetical protein
MKLITDWETNDKLSLKQRERYRQVEEGYLRERFSKREKVFNWDMKLESSIYLIYKDTLYKLKNELNYTENDEDNYYLFTRGNHHLIIPKINIIKKEGSIVWELL